MNVAAPSGLLSALVGATRPDAVAIRVSGRTVGYGELSRRSRRIASSLRKRGLGPEALVALGLDRSDDLVCWVLGCWCAGAAFLPVDPAYPPARLRYMLDDARPDLVVLHGASPSWAPDGVAHRVLEAEGSDEALAPVEPLAESLAYVIYTSGSTGKPKGVEVPFRGLENLARNQIETFAIDAGSRVLQFASPSFDAFVAEVLAALLAGATLVIGTRDNLVPGAALAELCAREHVSVATFPPSLLAVLDPAAFPSLRTIVSAGEACSPDLARRWGKGRRFVNAYGPTESTVCATEAVIRVDAPEGTQLSIGVALSGVETLVLDDQLEDVVQGDAGELVLGGIGLARGYRGRADLTGERFVPHPRRAGARVYRTGDLVRQAADGSLHYVGRRDDQAKVRGFRVELGEVEEALRRLAGVVDAAVVVRRDARAGDSLAAYVVPKASIGADTLRAQLTALLPPFMVPDTFTFLPAMPRSPNGKVDRRALPAPVRSRPASWPPAAAAVTPAEVELLALFRDVLGVVDCGIDDDFFSLGGHSLAAAVLLSRGRSHSGDPLSLGALVARPTVRALAAPVRDERELPACVVQLHPGASGQTPVFLFHPVSGSVGCYVSLAAELGTDRPVYGIQSAVLSGEGDDASFEAMCVRYAAAVRAVHPAGPFLLGGWSVGGSIAVEVGRLLAADGAVVPLVLLLDSWSPALHPVPHPVLDDALVTYLFIKNNLGRTVGTDLPITPRDVASLDEAARVELARHWAIAQGLYPREMPATELRRLLRAFSTLLRAFMAYDARPYLGRVLHIQATEAAPGHPRPPTLGWESLLPHAHVALVPDSTHFVFVYPPVVERYAQRARVALAEALS